MEDLPNTVMLEKSLEAAKDYSDCILKGSLSEIGGILSDTIGNWRLKNQIRLLLKTKELLEIKGIKPEKILPDIFIPIVEEAGNIENESLSEMFAALLANHLAIETDNEIHPSYTKVLSQLSSFDAHVMIFFRKWVSYKNAREIGLRGRSWTSEEVADDINEPKGQTYLSCLNLFRLGLLEHLGYKAPEEHDHTTLFTDSHVHQVFRITEYGIAFCNACGIDKEFCFKKSKESL